MVEEEKERDLIKAKLEEWLVLRELADQRVEELQSALADLSLSTRGGEPASKPDQQSRATVKVTTPVVPTIAGTLADVRSGLEELDWRRSRFKKEGEDAMDVPVALRKHLQKGKLELGEYVYYLTSKGNLQRFKRKLKDP